METTESYPMQERPNKIAIDAWKKYLQGEFITGEREVLPSLQPTDHPTPTSASPLICMHTHNRNMRREMTGK